VIKRILVGVVVFTAFTYGIDDLLARLRNKPGLDVHIERYLAIAEKFNKINYERTDPVTERCVYTLFPHFGQNPCWYVTRHTMRFIEIG
jgi:hypothetical protein